MLSSPPNAVSGGLASQFEENVVLRLQYEALPTFPPSPSHLRVIVKVSRFTPRVLFCFVAVLCAEHCGSADDATDFFEKRIRPVLVEHCYECHAKDADVIQGGLVLDHRDSMMRGGDSGKAVIPGAPDESLLIKAIRYEETEMPPDGKLDAKVIRDFEKWIQQGAVLPASANPSSTSSSPESMGAPPTEIDWKSARSFWAFRQPERSIPPSTHNPDWQNNEIDAFVLAKLESAGRQPTGRADRRTLIRRVTFDLTGLPPTPTQVEAFVSDDRPDAYMRLVNRLLSDSAHAERWARLWLDVARYAEDQAHKVGNNDSLTYPNAYLYRDWVVDAFAGDMPYDQFVRLQLAADQIDPDDRESHLALGFLGLGPKYYRRGAPEVMADEWEDRVDTVSRGLLGLTVACARCHDHKYDPIPTEDYYSLAGVFASTEMFNRPINESVETKNGEAKKPQDAQHIVRDGKPVHLNVMIRGDVNKRGKEAPRGFLQALCSGDVPKFSQGSGRAELADAIVDPNNPLTARVIVNRIWRQFMGRGLVETPSNFGKLGQRPSHPELLDHLALGLIDNGWSLKWLQRQIVTSATYQQSSQASESSMDADPANELYGRMSRRRLSIESYRDAVLMVAGQLDFRHGGRSIDPAEADQPRRTLYSEISRMELNPLLARFDFPDPNAHSEKRVETNTPLQKLFLLNSPFLITHSRALASQTLQAINDLDKRILSLYQRLYARDPMQAELDYGRSFLKTVQEESGAVDELGAWTQYAQALLISNEMFLLD